MTGELDIASLSRISNGWIITKHGGFFESSERIFCPTWATVLDKLRDLAFPYPNKEEPVMPGK